MWPQQLAQQRHARAARERLEEGAQQVVAHEAPGGEVPGEVHVAHVDRHLFNISIYILAYIYLKYNILYIYI